ncbi:hypothetical protein AAC387_Pa05g1854 [Persea americana]
MNKRPAAMEPSPKAQSESVESVRSKLRESLAAALALVSQQKNKLLSVGKSVENEAPSTLRQAGVDSQSAKSSSTILDADACHMQERPLEALASDSYAFNQSCNDGQRSWHENLTNENHFNSTNMGNFDGQEFHSKHISSDNEVSFVDNFIIKDDLLQGNGLCWASDLDTQHSEERQYRDPKRPKMAEEEITREQEQVLPSPLSLANKIESELFKLFGGVNKKYKEKGRSLLFNLKDRNNPELRERVMSGEIPPARLCCMTAEELASKELSQWRIAKAEELAQLVVLPDSDVDIRRLVKKTHKGEFQVEVDQDDSVSVEVAVGTSSFTQILSRSSATEGQIPSKSTENESQTPAKTNETEASKGTTVRVMTDSVDQSHSGKGITLNHNGTDLMQEIMVDELKDAEFLPPIVSLDEFMDSLDSEPPFENLPKDSRQVTPVVERSSDSLGSKLDSSNVGSSEPAETAPDERDQVEAKYTRTDSNLKPGSTHIESETDYSFGEIRCEHVWEGLVQLNISAMAMVVGVYKSGERTSTKDWPSLLEIKGRVRLDAFEKFVQELRMSRSRAIMVVQFCWKDGSPEEGRLHMLEVADSYVADERVGFAEPAPGMELYFCPPHRKMIEMLGLHLPKEHSESLSSVENGLIGIVVWRKVHVTTNSPKKSSFQRQNSKKQHSSLKRQKDAIANAKLPIAPLPVGPTPINPNPPFEDDLIDDIPPGFGPGAASGRDEDDLPEFDFANSSKPLGSQFPVPNTPQGSHMGTVHSRVQPSPRPTQKMRELINKYGQGKMGAHEVIRQPSQGARLETQPWNDDDDIPEWQPHQDTQPQPPPPPPPPLHSFQPQAPPGHLINQQLSTMPVQQPLVPLAVPLPVHLQSMRPQVGSLQSQQTMAAPWQVGSMQWAPLLGSNGPSDIGFQANGVMQPCHFGGQSTDGQFQRMPGYGVEPQGMDWRPDIPRSRGV